MTSDSSQDLVLKKPFSYPYTYKNTRSGDGACQRSGLAPDRLSGHSPSLKNTRSKSSGLPELARTARQAQDPAVKRNEWPSSSGTLQLGISSPSARQPAAMDDIVGVPTTCHLLARFVFLAPVSGLSPGSCCCVWILAGYIWSLRLASPSHGPSELKPPKNGGAGRGYFGDGNAVL